MPMFPKVHAVVRKIPRGKVSTYGAVARAAGFPGAARQVVWALRAGRDLPWHRVVGAKGKVMLPGELGLEQRLRLRTEEVLFLGDRVDLAACEHLFAARKAKQTLKPTGRSKAVPKKNGRKHPMTSKGRRK